MRHMAQCTYPKLALIRGVFGIQHQLDRFYQNLKMELVRIRHPSDSVGSIHLNPIFEEYEEDEQVGAPTQRQEQITEATRNMCLISLVKNPFLQIENNHRKLLYKRDHQGSKHSGDDANSIDSDRPQRGTRLFNNQSRGESPASGMNHRKFSFADSESVISETEEFQLGGGHGKLKGEGSRRIGSFLLPRTPTYALIKEQL